MSQPTRDSFGRFAAGNAGGPGRRRREVEEEYLRTLENVVSGEAWLAICNRAVLDATNGDPKARQWLTGYLLGMPISRSEESQGDTFADIVKVLLSGENREA